MVIWKYRILGVLTLSAVLMIISIFIVLLNCINKQFVFVENSSYLILFLLVPSLNVDRSINLLNLAAFQHNLWLMNSVVDELEKRINVKV